MELKTEDVNQLVSIVLETIHEPYTEDIIDEVFLKIEKNPHWLRQYKKLCDELNKNVVNVWIAKYTKKMTGLNSGERKASQRSKMIHSFTKLTDN